MTRQGLRSRFREARLLARSSVLVALLALPPAWANPSDRAPGLLRIDAAPLVLHHAPEQAALAERLAGRGPGEVTRIALSLGLPIPPRIDVFLLPSRSGDPGHHGLPGAPDWAAGYALIERPEIVLRTTQTHGPTGNDAATVFTHELVHSLVSQAVGARRHSDMPAWFIEGIASHLAYEWRLVHSAHVAGLALSGRYVPLRHLEQRFPAEADAAQLAYLESFAFLEWLTERSGEDALRHLLDEFRRGASFDDAFRHAYGRPWSELEDEWRPGFLLRHRWLPILTSSATLWLAVAGLFVAGGFAKRRRMRAKIAAWEEEERLLREQELPLLPAGDGEPPGSPERDEEGHGNDEPSSDSRFADSDGGEPGGDRTGRGA